MDNMAGNSLQFSRELAEEEEDQEFVEFYERETVKMKVYLIWQSDFDNNIYENETLHDIGLV